LAHPVHPWVNSYMYVQKRVAIDYSKCGLDQSTDKLPKIDVSSSVNVWQHCSWMRCMMQCTISRFSSVRVAKDFVVSSTYATVQPRTSYTSTSRMLVTWWDYLCRSPRMLGQVHEVGLCLCYLGTVLVVVPASRSPKRASTG